MTPSKLSLLLSVAILPWLASCGPSIHTLSHKDIHRHGSYAVDRDYGAIPMPTSTLIAEAVKKPRDKHKMPIYKFSERQRVVRTTAYTCSEADHIQYGSKNAAGTNLKFSNKVRSAAADWSFYPVGTVFRVKGMPQLYVIDDYGSALTGTGTIDMYKPSKAMMNQWGRRNVEITVLQWGSFERSAEILSGRTKHAHCRQMLANITRQRPDLQRLAMR